jgi:uncharacterized protein YndB with AHSA1/START domain
MAESVVERSVKIDAATADVWRVFTDPAVTRLMGGEYVSDWQVGSSFSWQGLDGTRLTRGIILQIEAEKLLQHNLFAVDDPGGEEGAPVVSVITYRLHPVDAQTILIGREEFALPLDEQAYADAMEGWEIALKSVKDLAENNREAQ